MVNKLLMNVHKRLMSILIAPYVMRKTLKQVITLRNVESLQRTDIVAGSSELVVGRVPY
jgi:hypothetical protein